MSEIEFDELTTRLNSLMNGVVTECIKEDVVYDLYSFKIDDDDDISIRLHKLKFANYYSLLDEPPDRDLFTILPNDILLEITEYLGWRDLVHFFITCKKMYELLAQKLFSQNIQLSIVYWQKRKWKNNQEGKNRFILLNQMYSKSPIVDFNSRKHKEIRFKLISHMIHWIIEKCDFHFTAGNSVEYLKSFFTHGIFSKSIDNDIKMFKIFFLEAILNRVTARSTKDFLISCGSTVAKNLRMCNCPLEIDRLLAYNIVEWLTLDTEIIKYLDGMYLKTQNPKYDIHYIMFAKQMYSIWRTINIFNF